MSIFHALVLGFVQGITEFLPVSSSGHLILFPVLFGWNEQPLAFDAVIHLGTLGAILFALRDDLPRLIENKGRLSWIILAASIPALGIGYLFQDQIESVLRSPLVVAASLAAWGMLLWIADRGVKATAEPNATRVGYRRAMFVGIAQAISLIPGTSRSGVTITAGLFTGLSREAAARFSFLLGIPAIAAAGGMSLLHVMNGTEPVAAWPLLVGFIAAFASGVAAIRLLLRLLKTTSYVPFVVYRLALAVAVVLLLG
jgi:undecaprenyl-diphosphatase